MMDDCAVVALQLGRDPRSQVVVGARCHLDLPVVIDVPPLLEDGTPFPTKHWLTCPLALLRISRIESRGGVREADSLIATDPEVAAAFGVAMRRYEEERDDLLPSSWEGPRPSGGVGGSGGGVKCLHAQYADTAVGNENPIGGGVAIKIEPLNCTVPCVALSDGVISLNKDWSEPVSELDSELGQKPT